VLLSECAPGLVVDDLSREGIHKPRESDRENDENEEVTDGREDAFFGGRVENAREDDGDEQRGKSQKGEVRGRELK